VDCPVGRARPANLPVCAGLARQLATLLQQPQHHLPGAAELVEVPEYRRDRVGDRLVRADPDPPALVVLEPGGQRQAQLALARLVQAAAAQPGTEHVQLGLGHRALQPEHEPIVVQARMVDPVRVGDQRVGQRAQIEQPVPVGVAARQPRDLDPEHDPDPSQPDLGDQPLETVAPVAAFGRSALVLVDDDHLPGRPAERDRPLDQLVLALAALAVALDLRHRRLAHVHVRPALQVLTLDPAHRSSSRSLRMCAIARANSRRIRSCAAGDNDSHIRSIRSGPSRGRASWRGVDSSPRTGLTSSSCWRFSSG